MELSHTLCQCWSRNHHRKLSHCRTRNHLWKLSRGWLMESTTNTNSRLTDEINRETESSLTHGIASETASFLTINCQRKHSRCRSWNRNSNLIDSWSVESTTIPTHQIDSKNRLMATTWNRHTHSANYDPEIVTENWVPVEREIIFENWVAADWWNRQRTLIHDWRMKSIEKIKSSLMLGITSETASLLTRNRQRKHSRCRHWNHNWNLSDSWRVESRARPTQQIDSKNGFMTNTWNCDTHSANGHQEIIIENWVTVTRNHLRKLSHSWLMESTMNTNSWLTHEINRETESALTHGIASETASLLTRNRQRKHSRCRTWNHNWNLSDSWRVESTARPTQQIDSKNRLMIQYGIVTHSTNADPEIVTENWVTVEREINCENWVAADWWNRQRTLIHDWRMKSIEK
jgi:hypothetical protein